MRGEVQERCTTMQWNSPHCSHCRKSIESIEHALAGWREQTGRTHRPVVVHGGARFCGYCRARPLDLRLEWIKDLRRSPMDVVAVALRRQRGDTARGGDRPVRLVWHTWVSIVLGLPFKDRDGQFLLDVVLTVEEMRDRIAKGWTYGGGGL